MNKNKLKITLLSIALFTPLMTTNVALASEVTGILTTGEIVAIVSPTANPVAGTYTSTQSVALIADGATSIRYTTDGAEPTCSTETTYHIAIPVSQDLTVKAISCYPNEVSSLVVTFSYVINLPTLTPTLTSSPSGSGGRGSGGGSLRNAITTSLPTNGLVLGASTGGGFQFTRTLTLGMSGNDVTELQNRLTAERVYAGPISGYFGPLTMAGVKAFQLKYGITPTGTIGPITRAKLNQGGSVLGATTMTIEQMKALLAQLQTQVAALMAKLNSLSH